jgi:hypothetical protein
MIKEGAPLPSRFDSPIDTCLTHQHNDVLRKIIPRERQGDEKLERIDHSLLAAKFNSYVRTWYVFYAADNSITQVLVFSMIHIPITVHCFFDYRSFEYLSSDYRSADCRSSDYRSSDYRSSDY